MNRRKFIAQSALGAAGVGLTSMMPGYVYGKPVSPSDKINVALIGCRNMGFGIFQHALSNPDVNAVAMCDIDQNVLNERANEVSTKFNVKPELFKDFRKLLERKDIDAVIIGTPDHWHCLNMVTALEAGKDVYVEKPMANTIGECNLMVKAAAKYKQVVQIGQQQRSGPLFIKAVELIKGGAIGKLRKVNVWANFKYGVGPQVVPDGPVPDGVDYAMWLGPAPERPFNQNRFHGSWRHFWDYGGGLMSDWGVHLLDIALWAKDITSGPEEVITYASNTFSEKRMRETFDTMSVVYPKSDFVIHYDLTAGIEQGPYNLPYGLAFIGDSGTLVVNRQSLQVFPEWDNDAKKAKGEALKIENGTESHNLHVRNFLDCIKSRNKTACPPEAGRAAALHAHIPNISARIGQPLLKWNESKNEFTNSAAANALITPAYRGPWKLPKV